MKQSESQRRRNNKTGIRVKNTRMKKKRRYLTYRQLFLIAGMLVIFMVSGIGYVWSNYEGTQIGYDLSRLQQKELMLKELNQKLRLELATLKSPQNLEDAVRGMGFKAVSQDQIITLP